MGSLPAWQSQPQKNNEKEASAQKDVRQEKKSSREGTPEPKDVTQGKENSIEGPLAPKNRQQDRKNVSTPSEVEALGRGG